MAEQRRNIFSQSSSSTSAYARHLQKVDAYIRQYGGEKPALGRGRTEREILEANHRFIREDVPDELAITHDQEKALAKSYYDNLFREFALIDLSRWRDHQVALRWRTKDEVLSGKGQLICASLHCSSGKDGHAEMTLEDAEGGLRTFELNFAYEEEGVNKNALVKVRWETEAEPSQSKS